MTERDLKHAFDVIWLVAIVLIVFCIAYLPIRLALSFVFVTLRGG